MLPVWGLFDLCWLLNRLGDVWRFPYITGQYGGGIFVLIYLIFIFALGLPIMTMEFAVGRASQKSIATSFKEMQGGAKMALDGVCRNSGELYTYDVLYLHCRLDAGLFLQSSSSASSTRLNAEQVGQVFDNLIANP